MDYRKISRIWYLSAELEGFISDILTQLKIVFNLIFPTQI